VGRFKPSKAKLLLNSNLSLRIHEFMLDAKKQVLDINENAVLEDNGSYYRFPSVQFTSEILEEGPVINKTIVI
jgi:hypothetical protein